MTKQAEFTNLAAKHAENEKFSRDERNEQSKFKKKHKLSDLDANLAYARVAVNFVRQKITVAANHDIYQDGSYDFEHAKTGKLDPNKRTADDKCVYETLRQDPDYQKIPNIKQCKRVECVEAIQSLARSTKCGNCYEQAAAAFMLLYRLDLRPIDYMSLYPRSLDHSFVVLGRTEGSSVGVDAWKKWGPGAVVCDPWAVGLLRRKDSKKSGTTAFGDAFGVYPAAQLGQKMKEMFPGFQQVDLDHYEE